MPRSKRLLPKGTTDKRWLYLLERGNGVIKVGFTGGPHYRYLQHRGDAKKRGGLVRFHLFGSTHWRDIHAAEKRAVAALAGSCSERVSLEEFLGITFSDALRIVREVA
jgi:hypothetical protein